MTKRKRILVIEDEAVNRKILNRILSRDYDVTEACNGLEGWEILSAEKGSFSAVMLDIVMPVMNGYEFLLKMQEAGINNIPVIVTTGEESTDTEQKALESGAWDYVEKPYNVTVLLRRLRNAIARSEVALYEQMQKMAAHDSLTGLHNRGRMFEQTRIMINTHPDVKFVFMRFDIDHFAMFNTSFGEDEGDKLLRYFANSFRTLEHYSDMCKYCRMNADVFCACVSYSGNPQNIQECVDSFQRQLSDYKKDYLLSLSVGVYVVDDPTLSIEEMYFRASVAAKKCKEQYETHLAYYDKSIGSKIEKNIAIQNEMQHALDTEQFSVYLQPKFSVRTEKICGAEALVRWIHPEKGIISPGDFIPVFEQNGFISKLDYYVWDKTCAMLAEWIKSGITPYPVSVNISRISLYNPGLTGVLSELVKKHGIAPSLLQLEVTESAYMSDPELMETTIRSLHMAGFTILMDDFGSGYSSLNTLKRIYIDVLKIDMKFLPVERETERGEIILACIIKMANMLGMSVVTEGVETKQQRDFLEGAGCDSIQGYYYSRPITRQEYENKYLNCNFSAVEEETAAPKNELILKAKNKTILVIDDSETDRMILLQNLKNDYHVKICDDGESGLAYLKNHLCSVSLILLDKMLPGISGLEFLNYCRMDSTLNSIPKIIITADDTVFDQVEAFKSGAYDYIAKPLTKEILLARVRHVMDISGRMLLFDSVENDYMHFAEHDSATGLLNKTAFLEISERIMHVDINSENALFVIDIDRFKAINDKYGHMTGDKVILSIADELKRSFRKTDFIGRFGGDEFVVLVTQLPTRDSAKKKADEIINSVAFRCMNELSINTSISIGIAFSEVTDDKGSLFERADQALYEAKNTGRGKAVVYGQTVPLIEDDDKPIVLVCSENPQVYPTIALAYGDKAGFVNVTSLDVLTESFDKYHSRIRTVCIDMQKKSMHDSDDFYNYLVSRGCGKNIPILAFCRDGDVEQMREALKLDVADLLSLPPQIEAIQQKLSYSILSSQQAAR